MPHGSVPDWMGVSGQVQNLLREKFCPGHFYEKKRPILDKIRFPGDFIYSAEL